jgi:hypothetical protein
LIWIGVGLFRGSSRSIGGAGRAGPLPAHFRGSFRRLVPAKFRFDVSVRGDIDVDILRAPTRTAPSSRPGSCLAADTLADTFGFFEQVIEEVADVVADSIDDGEDFFEDISNQVRSRHPEILRETSDVLGKLFGDTCM